MKSEDKGAALKASEAPGEVKPAPGQGASPPAEPAKLRDQMLFDVKQSKALVKTTSDLTAALKALWQKFLGSR